MSKNQKRDKVLAISITVLALIVILGIGYAFFSASVSNTNNEKLVTQTATLSLKFDDNDNGISGNLNLGESITKKFTLENTGTLDAYAKINWYNLINTYMNGSLTYNLEQSESENSTYTSVGTGNVPVSSTETTETLKNGILVPVNTKYYYKLTITLNNLEEVNQNSDINANFHSFFSLEEGTNSVSGVDKIQNLVAGANPCNYVTFNGEAPTTGTKWIIVNSETGIHGPRDIYESENACQTGYSGYGNPNGYECQSKTMTTGGWRIIGVMNNIDDGTGKKETRIKLVRNDALGNYSWDTSESSVNNGWGVNDWTQADLKNELNGDYLDTTLSANTMWYNRKEKTFRRCLYEREKTRS